MKSSHGLTVLLVSVLFVYGATACIGEFETCHPTGDCVLVRAYCGKCQAGKYLCPSLNECVDDFAMCSGLKGTFWDWTLPRHTRVELLLNATTLNEQIMQLQNAAPAIPRLYVPEYQWLNDDLHGVRRHEATSFPNGCGLGATWSRDTLREVGDAIATEARALHHWYTNQGQRGENGYWNGLGMTIYGPNVNLVRDPRWGRNQEVFSEDPLLTSVLTEGYVKGMQNRESGYMKAASCCKHFAVYDVETYPTGRKHYNAVTNGRNLWETYLPVFEACVKKANVSHIMCSYNEVNGVPACGNKQLLTNILRTQWGFPGFVVSDYDAWAQIFQSHHYCPNMTCAAATGINAGCDQEGGGNGAISQLGAAIQAGMTDAAKVKASFRRLFNVRFELGMFDPPKKVPFSAYPTTKISSETHMDLALRAARESICLYKNNRSVLPLSMGSTVAVIGPRAASTSYLQGNYAESPAWGVVSILEGMFKANGPSTCQFDTEGMDYHLDNDTWVTADTAQSCAARCTSDLSCNYFTYSAGRCYLLPNMWSARQTGYKGVYSGARSGLCLMTEGEDWTKPGDPAVPSDDSRECCQRCRANATCTRFTFFPLLGCFLNPSATTPSKNGFAISGGTASAAPLISFSEACADGLNCNITNFAPAIAAAQKASATVVVLGLDQDMESEGNDRESIVLPPNQYALVSQLRAAIGSKPLIAVFVHGGTFALENIARDADALIDAWYPAQQGGNAVADVIFGNYCPAGRATATYYKSDADLPVNLAQQDLYPNQTSGYKGLTYRYFTGTPVVPFGHGLSYTTFTYKNLVSPSSVSACGLILVNVSVTNTGQMVGDEVVQLYVKQSPGSVPAPQVRLADFQRIRLINPQETRTVTLVVRPEYRAVVLNAADAYSDQRTIVAGSIQVAVGGNQPGFGPTLTATIKVTGGSPLNKC